MAAYLAADTIRRLREERGLTQAALATSVGVTDKAVSKWETGRGLPDISLIESLAATLGVSVAELLTGDVRENANRSGNMLRTKFYVCPICGNVIHALGEGAFSCCGVSLPPLEAEPADEESGHLLHVERVDNDWYVSLDHPMTKRHFVSFMAYATSFGVTVRKLYPEQEAACRFPMEGSGQIYAYCNQHGLFRVRTPRIERSGAQARTSQEHAS